METLGNGSQVKEVEQAIARARQWLFSQQHADGYWVAELEGDSILQSETILLLVFLGREDSDLVRRLARRLLETQLPGGGWAMYPGGGVEISGSVKAYFALKLAGCDVESEPMVRARRAILAHGGADAVNSYTRFFLAMLGQIPYSCCPAVPPELVLLPRWFPVNLYAVSSWSRTIIVPLSIVSALQPVRRLQPQQGIRELFLKEPRHWPPLRRPGAREGERDCRGGADGEAPPARAAQQDADPCPPAREPMLGWTRFFRAVDHLLQGYQRLPWRPTRRRALRAAEQWMLARFERSDGLGAIFPPIVFSLVALRALGYEDDRPEVRYCLRQLNDLVLEDPDSGSARVQPCKSPVWDTAIAVRALAAGGVDADEPNMLRALEWLIKQQITRPGDWCENVAAEPGGWCFEFHNDFYPDSDDTAMVLMALAEAFRGGRERAANPKAEEVLARAAAAIDRGMKWVVAMQNDDGGWGAFDRNNDRQFLCHVPFADHNAMIDPSTPDLTARVLEALGRLGRRLGDPVVDRAVAYLRAAQEPDGAWFGRWGVNYVYGTWQTLVGLTAVGVPRDDPAVIAGARWLLAHQQPSGAWGESPDTYDHPRRRGQGPATPSQTAWAVMGLIAAGLRDHPAVVHGIQYLIDQQRSDGAWREPEFTGTGFPSVFYLRYHYYSIYFPLMALAMWTQPGAGPDQCCPRRTRNPSTGRTPGSRSAPEPAVCRRCRSSNGSSYPREVSDDVASAGGSDRVYRGS